MHEHAQPRSGVQLHVVALHSQDTTALVTPPLAPQGLALALASKELPSAWRAVTARRREAPHAPLPQPEVEVVVDAM